MKSIFLIVFLVFFIIIPAVADNLTEREIELLTALKLAEKNLTGFIETDEIEYIRDVIKKFSNKEVDISTNIDIVGYTDFSVIDDEKGLIITD